MDDYYYDYYVVLCYGCDVYLPIVVVDVMIVCVFVMLVVVCVVCNHVVLSFAATLFILVLILAFLFLKKNATKNSSDRYALQPGRVGSDYRHQSCGRLGPT